MSIHTNHYTGEISSDTNLSITSTGSVLISGASSTLPKHLPIYNTQYIATNLQDDDVVTINIDCGSMILLKTYSTSGVLFGYANTTGAKDGQTTTVFTIGGLTGIRWSSQTIVSTFTTIPAYGHFHLTYIESALKWYAFL